VNAAVPDAPGFDAFIAYRRADGAALAKWARRTIRSFRLSRDLLEAIPVSKREVYERGPRVFLDKAYGKPSLDWLETKIFPAVDRSDRLIVVSSPLALMPIPGSNGEQMPNWVAREIERFFETRSNADRAAVDVVVGPGADMERFPGKLADFRRVDPIDLRGFGRLAALGLDPRLGKAAGELVAAFYDIPIVHLPLLRDEERRQRQRRTWTYGLTVLGLMLAAFLVIDHDRHQAELERRVAEAEILFKEGNYAASVRVAQAALPRERELPWRPGRSDPRAKRLLVTLAGAAHLSSYGKQVPTPHSPTRSASFDPPGSRLATGSSSGSIFIWDLRNGPRVVQTCTLADVFPDRSTARGEGSTDWIRDVRFVANGAAVLSAGPFGAWLWRPGSRCNDAIRFVGFRRDVRTASLSPDGRTVATTSDDGSAWLWDARTGVQRCHLDLPASVLPPGYDYTTDAEFSPDGGTVAVSRRDGLIALAEVASCRRLRVLQDNRAAVWSLRFDSRGERLVSASANGNVSVWVLSTGQLIQLPRQARSVSTAMFVADGSLVLTAASDGTVQLWDLETAGRIAVVRGHDAPLLLANASLDGTRLVTSSDDLTTRIWELPATVVPQIVRGFEYPITSASMSRDGRALAVGDLDGRVRVFSVENGRLEKLRELRLGAGPIVDISISESTGDALLASEKGDVLRWTAKAGAAERVATLPRAPAAVAGNHSGDVALGSSGDRSSTGEILYAGVNESVRLERGERITRLEFSPHGDFLLGATESVSADGLRRIVRVWNARSGKEEVALEHPTFITSAHWSSDGTLVVTGSIDRLARIWNARSGTVVQEMVGHDRNVTSARLSQDGKSLVTTSGDRSVRIWHVETGATVLRHELGVEPIDAFFTRDGNWMIVVTQDGVLTFDVRWTKSLDALLAGQACDSGLLDAALGACPNRLTGKR
jgi:WD40 repeat protein